jgi:excisionase family DNA binding protein
MAWIHRAVLTDPARIAAEESALSQYYERFADALRAAEGGLREGLEQVRRRVVVEIVEPIGRYLTVDACAMYLGRTSKAVRRLVERGELPCIRLGRRVQFDRVAVDRWIARHSCRGKRIA